MASGKQNSGNCLPVAAVVMVQVVFAVMNVLIKQALDEGMSRFVLITYRQFVATIFISPIAYYAERHTRPKLTSSIFLLLFLSALLGMTTTQYFFFFGLEHTSATFSCAFINMVPALTFVIAVALRMEILNIKSKYGVLKVAGTIVCVSGAMLLTLYKGRALTHNSSSHLNQSSSKVDDHESQKSWLLGSLSLLAGSLGWSSWFILQARIANFYPALYSSNALVSLLSCIQSAAFTLIVHRDPSLWLFRGKLQIVTVLYSGAMCSGMGYIIMAWCVEKRGPVFTAAFSPLIQVVVAIIEVLFLHEQLHLGSILGSIIIVIGLYMLLCGKTKQHECLLPKQIQVIDDSTAV